MKATLLLPFLLLFLSLANAQEEAALRDGLKDIAAMYQKKFGEPIKYDELLITRVYYSYDTHGRCSEIKDMVLYEKISITRNADGALLKYENCNKQREAKLTTSQWLDFIREFYKCRIDEWKSHYQPGNYSNDGDDWNVSVSYLDMKPKTFSGYDKEPPSMREFEKALKKLTKKNLR